MPEQLLEPLEPGWTGVVGDAIVRGCLRDEAGVIVWHCEHSHMGREYATACARNELERRERDG